MKSWLRTAVFVGIAIIMLMALTVNLAIADMPIEQGMTRLNMKFYGNHNAKVDARILAVKPQFLIDNPPHGLYGEMDEQRYHENYTYSYLLQNIPMMQSAGIKVIGYISGGYEGKGGDDGYAREWYSLKTNKMLVKNMATIDKVDGVFIDECSAYPDWASRVYLKTLSDYAHSYGLIVWGNTGVSNFSEWYFTEGGFDYMQSTEAWRGGTLSAVERKWGHRISVTGFRRSYKVDDAVRLTLDAWTKGLAFAYINTREYTRIAPWFEEYATRLRVLQ